MGDSGGVIPVEKDELVAILKEEYIENPEYWIASLIDFGMLQNNRSTFFDGNGYKEVNITYNVNPMYRNILNLEYFKKYEIV